MIGPLVRLWLIPVVAFWSWYFLSLYDVAPASGLFSRFVHDAVLALCGDLLGINPTTIPSLLAKAFVMDGLVVVGLMSWHRRRTILASMTARLAARQSSLAANSAESLSSAP